MCFHNLSAAPTRIDTPRRRAPERLGDPDFARFVKESGGLESFGRTGDRRGFAEATDLLGSITRARKAFNDLSQIPGPPSPQAIFAGARIDEDKTRVSDLKFLPRIPTS